MTIRAVDLFSGPGGLTLGLKAAGVEPVCAVEFSRDAMDTYSGHTPEASHYCADIREVDLSPIRGKVDLVYGGPPCQPFSSGGLRNGMSDSRNKIPAFLAAVRLLQPAAVLMENVPGLATGNRLPYLRSILAELGMMGYMPTWRVLNAADFGVPQKRRRLFVVGLRGRLFRFPAPLLGPRTGKPYVTAGEALATAPHGEPNGAIVVYAKNPDLRPNPYDGHLFNGGGRPIDLTQPSHTVLASAGGNKTHFIDQHDLVPEYHRRLMAGGAPRIGILPGGRRLTVAESATLQTFPPGTAFAGRRSSQYRQVGDAVPPLLAAALGLALTAQMNGAATSDPQPNVAEPAQQALL